MKNKILCGVVFMIVIFTVACSRETSETPQVNNVDKVPVATSLAVEMDFEETFLSIGSFVASDVLKIYTGGVGDVERIMISPGELVNKGDLLFTLNQSSFENSYKATESQLRTIRENAKIKYQDAQTDFEQNSILFDSGALSKSDLDSSRSNLSVSKKNYQDAMTNYNSQVATLKDALEDRMVTSPIEGVVGAIYIDENQRVQNIVALEVINDDQMFVEAWVTGKVLAYIAEGDAVRIYPDGEVLNKIEGRVESYNIIADETTGLFKVKVLVTESVPFSRTGEYAEVEFVIKERVNPAVLRKSVLKENETNFVYIIKEGIAYKRAVIIGEAKQQYVEILEGLGIDEHIVIQGQSFLDDGDEVEEQIN